MNQNRKGKSKEKAKKKQRTICKPVLIIKREKKDNFCGLNKIELLTKIMRKVMKKNYEGLREKVVIVTGASSGIGKQVVEELGTHKAKIILFARNEKRLSEVEQKLKEKGVNTIKIVGDIRKEEDIEKLVEETVTKYGRIDILFNNAGYGKNIDFLEQKEEEIEDMIKTNVIGLMKLTKKVANVMKNQGEGQIINMSSAIAAVPTYTFTTYCVTKGAVKTFSESIREELKKYGIAVSTIYPALHDTPFCKKANIDPEKFKTYKKEELAKEIVKVMKKKKEELYYPKVYGIVAKTVKNIPKLRIELSKNFTQKLKESRIKGEKVIQGTGN